MNEFYSNIEEPIRGIVRELRDNGINTVCSCGHEMYVDADLSIDTQLKRMHDITYTWLVKNGEPVEYSIVVHLVVTKGIVSQCFAEIKIG